MKKYERSHPWISFRANFSDAQWILWVQLGEAASKCIHLANVCMRPETAQKLHQLYLAKGAAATTAIEGNTLTEEEVLRHVQGKLTLPPSEQYLQQEVDNIIHVCNSISKKLASEGGLPPLTTQCIAEYNEQIRHKLAEAEGTEPPGKLRLRSVLVGTIYRGAPAEDCPYLLDRLCDWLNGPDFGPREDYHIPFAILKAIVCHVYIAWIHPFGDGNGRTARLLELHILLNAGVPQPAAHLLSNHYNQTRPEYYRHLDYASKSDGDLLPFVNYAVKGFVDGLRDQLKYVWDQQWDIAWRDHVYTHFRGRDSKSQIRQRHLALDLGKETSWVSAESLNQLSERLAIGYAGKTAKTVQRDMNALLKLGLVERRRGEIRARRDVMLAFSKPLRRQVENDSKIPGQK
jgi:Fic family protein